MPTRLPELTRFAIALLLPLLLPACSSRVAETPATDPRLADSRAATMRLGHELKSRLIEVLGEQGPVAAVAVCAEEAPAIATRLSTETGARVGRTALRFRNPDNAPLDWQIDVLQLFTERMAGGADPAKLEFSATTDTGGFRYMKAIPTGPACLVCHGKVRTGALADAIRANYPDDDATGFSSGELRGAFVIEWSDRS